MKQAIAGYGKADKAQMQEMVRILLHLDAMPHPDDAADALAVAICHVHSQQFRLATRQPPQTPSAMSEPRKARTPRVRLDQLLVDRALVKSRSQAQAIILAGQVRVGTDTRTKAGELVSADVEVLDRAARDSSAAVGKSWITH